MAIENESASRATHPVETLGRIRPMPRKAASEDQMGEG
jgi:hypothetical protein